MITLILQLFIVSRLAVTQEDYCYALKTLISQNQPNFSELNRLKALCGSQLANSPETILNQNLNGLDIAQILKSAHLSKIQDRISIVNKLNSIIEIYQKQQRQVSNFAEKDQFFMDQLKQLSTISKDFEGLKQKNIFDYYPKEVIARLQKVYEVSKHPLVSNEVLSLIQNLKNLESKFQIESNNIIKHMDDSITKTIDSITRSLNAAKSILSYQDSEATRNAFLQGISKEIIALKAITSWNQFMIRSKIHMVLFNLDQYMVAGLKQTALATITGTRILAETFLSTLPKDLGTAIQRGESFKTLNLTLAKKEGQILSLTDAEISARQKIYIGRLMQATAPILSQCLVKYPHFKNKWNDTQKDYDNLAQLKNNESLRRFVIESISNRVQILKDLCKGEGR